MAVLEMTADPPLSDAMAAWEVEDFTEWLVETALPVDDPARLELITALETLKSAMAATQVELTAGYAASVRQKRAAAGGKAEATNRGIAAEVGLARKESPQKAAQLVKVATCLVDEMPKTLAALSRGETNEWRATIAVRESALLTPENRRLLDEELAARLSGKGDAEVGRMVRTIGQRLDPDLAYKLVKKAEQERRVTIRPAPDCMALVSAYLPMAEGVAVYAALTKAANTAAVDVNDGRSRGQVMVDTLADRVLGRVPSEPVSVEIQLIVSDETLAGGNEPGTVHGYGPIPAPLARLLADPPDQLDRADHPGQADQPDTEANRWIRRLWASPLTGELTQMESKRRIFPPGLRRFVVARDQYCRTPWCSAPIRQIDHAVPVAQGGPTSAAKQVPS